LKIICGFQIQLWEGLGFKFDISDWFEGGQIWYAEKEFDNLIFSLRINTYSSHTLAKIENLERQKLGNHVVSESEAIDWFSSKSRQFLDAYQQQAAI
jgi:hypothetical protein